MQYHYVVAYDTETCKWFVESDTDAYFLDGNVFHPDRAESAEWDYNGWYPPEYASDEAGLDKTLHNIIYSILDTFPTPKESHAT